MSLEEIVKTLNNYTEVLELIGLVCMVISGTMKTAIEMVEFSKDFIRQKEKLKQFISKIKAKIKK